MALNACFFCLFKNTVQTWNRALLKVREETHAALQVSAVVVRQKNYTPAAFGVGNISFEQAAVTPELPLNSSVRYNRYSTLLSLARSQLDVSQKPSNQVSDSVLTMSVKCFLMEDILVFG